jgi:hypothetical protein
MIPALDAIREADEAVPSRMEAIESSSEAPGRPCGSLPSERGNELMLFALTSLEQADNQSRHSFCAPAWQLSESYSCTAARAARKLS